MRKIQVFQSMSNDSLRQLAPSIFVHEIPSQPAARTAFVCGLQDLRIDMYAACLSESKGPMPRKTPRKSCRSYERGFSTMMVT